MLLHLSRGKKTFFFIRIKMRRTLAQFLSNHLSIIIEIWLINFDQRDGWQLLSGKTCICNPDDLRIYMYVYMYTYSICRSCRTVLPFCHCRCCRQLFFSASFYIGICSHLNVLVFAIVYLYTTLYDVFCMYVCSCCCCHAQQLGIVKFQYNCQCVVWLLKFRFRFRFVLPFWNLF